MPGRSDKIGVVAHANFKQLIVVTFLSLVLFGLAPINNLFAQEDFNRNDVLRRIHRLKRDLEKEAQKLRALIKRYESLFRGTQLIEKRIEREKQQIEGLKERRKIVEAQRRAEEERRKTALEQKQQKAKNEAGAKNTTDKRASEKKTEAQRQKEAKAKRIFEIKRQKEISRMLRQLQSQKQQQK